MAAPRRVLAAARARIEADAACTRPFAVVDPAAFRARLALWAARLPRVAPFYAVKCNPAPALLRAAGAAE